MDHVSAGPRKPEGAVRFQSGRAGNHLPEGWMVAADLTPTIFGWLGLAPPDRFVGEPINEALTRPDGEPR